MYTRDFFAILLSSNEAQIRKSARTWLDTCCGSTHVYVRLFRGREDAVVLAFNNTLPPEDTVSYTYVPAEYYLAEYRGKHDGQTIAGERQEHGGSEGPGTGAPESDLTRTEQGSSLSEDGSLGGDQRDLQRQEV